MEQKIVVQHLSLSYGSKKALDDVSLDVPTGQIMALIGPSGCGKSTLLRSMNRMHDLNHSVHIDGKILLDGRDIYAPRTDVVGIRRQIGMVFQQPNPFPKSIFDNVAYGLRINGLTNKQELSEAVEQSLRSSSLWDEVKDVLDRSALSLSGGQQQRLCIARTIAVQPEVILMDEPCSALDPISTGKVEELMRELKKKYTLIVVTHNMAQAQRVADLTTMMYDGHIIETAPTKQLFEQPQEDVTKNYVQGHFG